MGLQTKRFNTGAGVVLAAVAGAGVWALTCWGIYAAVAS
jgi:hypothetical protein